MEFLDHLRLLGRSEATIRIHQGAQALFGRFWGVDRDLREVAPADLEAYAKEVRARVSRETAYLYLTSLRGLFRFLVDARRLLLDPSLGLPMPKMNDRLTGRILSREEMKRLVESPDSSTIVGLRDRAILEFLYSTGLRASENRRVRVADLREDSVFVAGGKGGKGRMVPIGRAAAEWVAKYLASARGALLGKDSEAGALFLSKSGRPLEGGSVREIVRRWGRAAGIAKGVGPHTLRRSCATGMIRNRANPAHVKDLLGHEDFTSLKSYIRLEIVDLKDAHRRFHPREREEDPGEVDPT